MGSQSPSTSTVTNTVQVDPVTQAWRNQIMQLGGAYMNQGAPAYYPGNTVVPFSNQTQTGLDYLQNYSMQGAPNLQAANDATARMLTGWNPAMPYAANAATGGLNNQQTGALSSYTSGQVNPALQSLFQQGAGDIANVVNAQFSQAGRFGANAAHTGELTRQVGNLWNQIYAPAYEAERNRGLQASTAMAGIGADDANRQLTGAELFGAMFSQGNQDAIRAQALMPSLYSYGLMPGQGLLDVGGMYEGLAGQYLGADQAAYNYNANAPWQMLQDYAGMMSGMPDFSGTTSQTTQQAGTNNVMTGLGALATVGSLFGSGGLFSDRRLKREIVRVGTVKGLPWYRFAYLWDAPGTVRFGVMADEAPAHAVSIHPSGFAVVDYGAL